MPLTQALLKILRHAVAAVAGFLFLAVALEWLMPGAAMPFFDAMDPLLMLSVLAMLLFLPVKRKPGWLNTLQVAAGILFLAGLLAILALSVPNYGPTAVAMLIAAGSAIAVWAMTYLKAAE